ncbi:MAG: SH3 domain-containing protein [Spirochaetales bacterium]|nr:SH3 domain-containing protein [Spirochaetales bacterium]
MNRTYTGMIIFLLILLSSLVSCGGGSIGYGVVLWSADENVLLTGQKYLVLHKSDIKGIYTVRLPEQKGEVEIEQWRIEFFSRKSAAENYIRTHAEYFNLYARAEEDRLPVRDEPSVAGKQIYVAKYREIMKVIRQTDIHETIGTFDGYWYEVLTANGTRGYRFGLNLNVFDINTAVEEDEYAREMAQIKRVLGKEYRTQYAAELIANGTVNLDLIKPAFGFFPDPANSELDIITKDYHLTAHYDSINYLGVINGARRFSFEGANIQISVHNDNLITLHYSYNRKEHGGKYVYIENLNEIIANEELRRAEAYESIFEKGSPLKSETYGTITLFDDARFVWSNYNVLVPDVIRAGAGSNGWITMDVFLAPALRSSYKGAMTFNFNTGQKVVFAWQISPAGMRLVHIPDRIIEDKIITSDPAVKRIAFFTFPD